MEALFRTPEHELSPEEAWARVEAGRVQVVDLQEPHEPDSPRVPGSRDIPLSRLAHEAATLDHDRPVLLVSGRGHNAALATQAFRAAGITAWSVAGGIRAWIDAGLPVEED